VHERIQTSRGGVWKRKQRTSPGSIPHVETAQANPALSADPMRWKSVLPGVGLILALAPRIPWCVWGSHRKVGGEVAQNFNTLFVHMQTTVERQHLESRVKPQGRFLQLNCWKGRRVRVKSWSRRGTGADMDGREKNTEEDDNPKILRKNRMVPLGAYKKHW
jgi:hypothetical protein